MNDFDHLRSAARRYCVGILSRSAASSRRNKPRPLLWVAMIFMTSAWALVRSARPRLELCARCVGARCARALLCSLAALQRSKHVRSAPLHVERPRCAFTSAARLYSSSAPLQVRSFTAAARLCSAVRLQQRRAFTAARVYSSGTPLQFRALTASARLYSAAPLQLRHAFAVPRVYSCGG